MKYITSISAIAIIGLACLFTSKTSYADGGKKKKGEKHEFVVSGDIANMPDNTASLELLWPNDSVTFIDSQKVIGGHFEFKGTTTEPGIYRVHFKLERNVLLSLDEGKNYITAAWPMEDGYNITGAAPSVELHRYIDYIRGRIQGVSKMMAQTDSIKNTGNQVLSAEMEKKVEIAKIDFRNFLKTYSDTIKFLPNSILSARMINPAEEFAYMESFDKKMKEKYSNFAIARVYNEYFKRVKASMPQPTEIGDPAPELSLENMEGKNVTLSSFKGKYVLVDFWASWCGPCRGENPNVVAAYNKFKNKNFTILGVSLDNNKDAWQKAVTKDGLPWTHVSDLKGWQSGAAATYSVHSIPANFLLDPTGKIIAKNLRGSELESKLAEFLK